MAPFQNFQTLQRKTAEYNPRGASRVEGLSLFEVVVRRFQPFLRNATEYSSSGASRVEGSPLSQLGDIILVRHTARGSFLHQRSFSSHSFVAHASMNPELKTITSQLRPRAFLHFLICASSHTLASGARLNEWCTQSYDISSCRNFIAIAPKSASPLQSGLERK